MDIVSATQQWFSSLLGEYEGWPDSLPDVDLADALYSWAETHVQSVIPPCSLSSDSYDPEPVLSIRNYIAGSRWLRLLDRGPIPIGRQALLDLPRFGPSSLGPTSTLERLAIFSGNEWLDVVLSGSVADSSVEVFFLWQPTSKSIEWRPLDPRFRDLWRPLGPQFRITGDPSNRAVVRFLRNVRHWWRERAGDGDLAGSLGGRPRIPISYEMACDAYRQILASLEREEDRFGTGIGIRRPTDRDLLDNIARRISHRASQRTFTRLKKDWEADGNPWPPEW